MTKSWKVWEEKVAADLGLVRVHKQHFGQAAPDVVQVTDPSQIVTGFWTEVRLQRIGPLVGECKSRSHKAIPAYLFKALDDPSVHALKHKQPAWVAKFVAQAERCRVDNGPAMYFVAVRKKTGRGKGTGARNFVILRKETHIRCFSDAPHRALMWDAFVMLDYDCFVSLVRSRKREQGD